MECLSENRLASLPKDEAGLGTPTTSFEDCKIESDTRILHLPSKYVSVGLSHPCNPGPRFCPQGILHGHGPCPLWPADPAAGFLSMHMRQRLPPTFLSRAALGMWVVVKIMVLFWILNTIRHLIFRDPRGDHNLGNHPCGILHSTYTQQGLVNQQVVPSR